MIRAITITAVLGAALALAGCEGAESATSDVGGADTPANAPDVGDASEVAADPETDSEPTPWTLAVGDDACCLTVRDGFVVWSQGGDLWWLDPESGEPSVLVDAPGEQRDPAIADGHLVWADARDGDFDLWTMDLETREATALIEAPGDQDMPTAAGGIVAFVSREQAPHTAREAEIVVFVRETHEVRSLTNDQAEQGFPHTDGESVVWTDYRNDPDSHYQDIADPSANNADILGFDLGTGEEFVVTDDPSKQLRPAIHGDGVVWMDWRGLDTPIGVTPEPKYKHFQVYARVLPQGPPIHVASSSWSRPELWRRPAVLDDTVAWIAEPSDGVGQTAVFVSPLEQPEPRAVHHASLRLRGVALTPGSISWIGASELGSAPLDALPQETSR